MDFAISYDDIISASKRLAGHAIRTPLIEVPAWNARLGGRLFLKLECLQLTGSFKFRGAYNRLVQLTEAERRKGVVAFSSGNHAQGVAYAARLLGIHATIVMPQDAPAAKIDGTRSYGAELRLYDRYSEDREAIAHEISTRTGAVVVPSYNDPHIMAGQGTIGLEIVDDLKRYGVIADQAIMACSGGGLSSGVLTALRQNFPDIKGFIVEPAGFDDTLKSLQSGQRETIDNKTASVCDALLASTPGALTFPMLKDMNVSGVTVTDAQALEAVKMAAVEGHFIAEPGGAAPLAAIMEGKLEVAGKNTVCIISGGNIDGALLKSVL